MFLIKKLLLLVIFGTFSYLLYLYVVLWRIKHHGFKLYFPRRSFKLYLCDDIQDRLLTTNDSELAKLLDACYCRLSYVSQRINNYIIIHGGK